MATHVRKRRLGKWWVLEKGTDREVAGPFDTKEEAQSQKEALDRN
ncbi:hypothetical protein ACQPZP_42510 [Spirillospora sp. CA-142024]